VSYYDLLESQNDSHLVGLFSQCDLGWFLKSDISFGEMFGLCQVLAVIIFASFKSARK
jgi:hypothetical protein